MRAAGNLAGVEFIHPPRYHNQTELWREIITESGYFFTKDAARYFGSRIAWDTLTAITGEIYGFVTSEQDSSKIGRATAWDGQRRYTVNLWTKERGVFSGSDFGEFETLAAARKYLRTAGFSRYLEAQNA
jgi:hypothetical protein